MKRTLFNTALLSFGVATGLGCAPANTADVTSGLSASSGAPSRLAYPTQSIIVTQGSSISEMSPTNAGERPTEYTVSPALPPGLSLNRTTGALSGKPTTPQAPVYYLVTASNGASKTATTVAIQVVPKDGYTSVTLPKLTGPAEARTNFTTMPFTANITSIHDFGSSAGLAPMNLFWKEGTHFTDPKMIATVQADVARDEAAGLVSSSGLQRWQPTYIDTLPPSSLTDGCADNADYKQYFKDRLDAPFSPLDPAMHAWSDFVSDRKELLDTGYDGLPNPSNYRCFGGSWGWIAHVTPLDSTDCPPGQTECTYGDMEANQWGGVAKLTGLQGMSFADFYDSNPFGSNHFNARVVQAFEYWRGVTVPGNTTAEKATYILHDTAKHACSAPNESSLCTLFNDYIDFQAEGWARYLAAFAQQIQANTGKQPLLAVQCGGTPALSRLVAADHRVWSRYINPGNILLMCDQTTLWRGRPGNPSIVDVGQSPLLAAKEPSYRIGATMIAEAGDFWGDVREAIQTANKITEMNVSNTGPVGDCWNGQSTDQADQKPLTADECEWGRKEIKHGALELSWAHIADQNGHVRRALASMQRFNFDAGTWDPAIIALAQGHHPTRPFGYGFYYSSNIERALEAEDGQQNNGDQYDGYLTAETFLPLKYQDQAAVDYIVTDIALAALGSSPSAKPAAWIVPQASLMPKAELAALTKIAPVLSTDLEITNFNASGKAPLSFSKNVSGIGFYDQSDNLIITATNLVWANNEAKLSLSGLSSGTYKVTELSTQAGSTNLLETTLDVVDGRATLPVSLGRYDTRVFSISK